MRVERHGFLIVVGDADGRVELLPERYLAAAGVDRPLAAIHQRIGVHELVRRVVGLAQHTDSDLDEQTAGLSLVVIQGAVGRSEFLYRACDRIRDHRIVVRKPDAKVSVTFIRQARE